MDTSASFATWLRQTLADQYDQNSRFVAYVHEAQPGQIAIVYEERVGQKGLLDHGDVIKMVETTAKLGAMSLSDTETWPVTQDYTLNLSQVAAIELPFVITIHVTKMQDDKTTLDASIQLAKERLEVATGQWIMAFSEA